LANVTHDLLIPLTVLKGHLSAMRNDSTSLASLQPAIHEAHYIGALVQNLAAAARLEAAEAPLQLGPVDLCALVDRVAARHRPIARPHGVALTEGHPEETLWAQADLTLLEAAVSNLAYNAVRHNTLANLRAAPRAALAHEEGEEAMDVGGHVAIVLDTQGDHFEIQVIDDGPGIAPDALSRLLARGARGDEARSRSPEGQGIGLDIVLRIVAAHGFQIDFGPVEGGGLRVLIRGPLLPAPPGVSSSNGRVPS
jgi:signal transduction histidine kinase